MHTVSLPETKRQATQHGCLPRLLGDGDKEIKIVCGGTTLIKKNIQFSSYIRNSEGSVAKSYMTNGLLIYGEKFAHFLIY
jgi:hypothetical protein